MAAPARPVSRPSFVTEEMPPLTISSGPQPVQRDTMAPFPDGDPLLYRQPIERDDPSKICELPRTLFLLMHDLKRAHSSILDLLIQTGSFSDPERVVRIRQWLNEHGEEIEHLPRLNNLNPTEPGRIPPLPPEAILLKSLSPLHKALVLASFLYHNNEKYAREALESPDFIRPEHKFSSLILAACYSNNVQLFRELKKLFKNVVIHEDFHEHLACIRSPDTPSRWIELYEELSTIPQLMAIEEFGSVIEGYLLLNEAMDVAGSFVLVEHRDENGNQVIAPNGIPFFELRLNPALQERHE